jgi:hypothetical protein
MTQTLEQLEARIQTLEQSTSAPDQLTPSVFSLNAAGEVEEKLSGKLEAKGIVFEEGEEGKEEAKHSIKWFDGALNSQTIHGYRTGTHHILDINAFGADAELARLIFEVGPLASKKAEIRAIIEGTTGVAEEAKILDAGGLSSFYFKTEAEALAKRVTELEELLNRTTGAFPLYGAISAEGAIESGSGGFTVTKTEKAHYKINWTKAFAAGHYLFVATCQLTGENAFPIVVTMNVNEVVLFIANVKGENPSLPFSFIAQGKLEGRG